MKGNIQTYPSNVTLDYNLFAEYCIVWLEVLLPALPALQTLQSHELAEEGGRGGRWYSNLCLTSLQASGVGGCKRLYDPMLKTAKMARRASLGMRGVYSAGHLFLEMDLLSNG